MADKSLRGNGYNCPACALRRDQLRAAGAMDQVVSCNYCGGSGRVPRALQEIFREACAHAAIHFWPEREAAWRRQSGAV